MTVQPAPGGAYQSTIEDTEQTADVRLVVAIRNIGDNFEHSQADSADVLAKLSEAAAEFVAELPTERIADTKVSLVIGNGTGLFVQQTVHDYAD